MQVRLKRLLYIVVSMMLIKIFTLNVNAANELQLSEEAKAEESRRIQLGGISPDDVSDINWEAIVLPKKQVSSRDFCVNCRVACVTVCAAEGVMGDVWYHSTLFTQDCKVTQIKSRGGLMCPVCHNVLDVFDYHDCWEIHTKCSKGNYDICPMMVS